MLVADIYNIHVFPLQESLTVKQALETLIHKDYNGVIVLDKAKNLVGILSLQDIAAAIVPVEMREDATLAHAMYKPNFFQEQCRDMKEKIVKDIMRKDFITVTPATSVMEVAADFLHNDLYIIPVCEEKEVIGIVTRSEIKKALAIGMEIPLK